MFPATLWRGRADPLRCEREPPIRCRCAHDEQLAATLLREVEMLLPLKRFDERGKKRHKVFGADTFSGMPDQEKRVLDCLSRLAVGAGAEVLFAPPVHA
jgi:hypothetical protein